MDEVASDHPSVTTLRATVARHGARRRLDLPASAPSAGVDAGVVRAVVEDRTRFAAVDAVGGTPAIVGLYDTLEAASAGDPARDGLNDWLAGLGRGPGRTVLVDVLEPGSRIGLRDPGDRTVYMVVEPPDEGLDAIARDLLDG